MKLRDWLDVTDVEGLYILIYDITDEKDPMWDGFSSDIPYWLTKFELAVSDTFEQQLPIDYRADLGEEYNHKAGFVIVIE